jgi:hypothetical protein
MMHSGCFIVAWLRCTQIVVTRAKNGMEIRNAVFSRKPHPLYLVCLPWKINPVISFKYRYAMITSAS